MQANFLLKEDCIVDIDRSGIILYVENYEDCVSFYADVIELKIEFQTPSLTSFAFGNSYLMIERGGAAISKGKGISQSLCILRMNVADVKMAAGLVSSKGVEAEYVEHEWGTVAKFVDPDGNHCEFKDTEKFDLQVSRGLEA
jgi:lactoylglutathione lyase